MDQLLLVHRELSCYAFAAASPPDSFNERFASIQYSLKLLITFPLLQSQPCQLFGHFMLQVFYRPLPPHFPLCLEIETKWKELLWRNGRCKDYLDEIKLVFWLNLVMRLLTYSVLSEQNFMHLLAERKWLKEVDGRLVSWMQLLWEPRKLSCWWRRNFVRCYILHFKGYDPDKETIVRILKSEFTPKIRNSELHVSLDVLY